MRIVSGRRVTWSMFLICATLVLTVAACATASAKRDLVRQRAVFDMGCEQLQFTDLGNNVYGAYGCGRRATYVVHCDSDSSAISACTAVLNSDPDHPAR